MNAVEKEKGPVQLLTDCPIFHKVYSCIYDDTEGGLTFVQIK